MARRKKNIDIDKMEAGREMDLSVVSDVMKWDIHFAPLEFQGDHNWLKDEANYPYVYVPVSDSPLILFMKPDQDGTKFSPSTDISAAWLVEERIEELELIRKYCDHLSSIVWPSQAHPAPLPLSWYSIHATPEDRCRAALKVING